MVFVERESEFLPSFKGENELEKILGGDERWKRCFDCGGIG